MVSPSCPVAYRFVLSCGACVLACLLILIPPAEASDTTCAPEKIPVEGNSLAGIIFDGAELDMHLPGCRAVLHRDLLVFRTSLTSPRYIKEVWGLPGETLAIVERNRVQIAGRRVLLPSGRELRLSRFELLKVSKLAGELEGFFVVGVPGSLDSTDIGLIDQKFVLGSVERGSIKTP